MIIKNEWWDSLPESVTDYAKQSQKLRDFTSVEGNSDWRAAYLKDVDADDTEVVGLCIFGPLPSSGLLLEADALDLQSLMICVASAARELSSTTMPVLVTDDTVQNCLTACGINSQLYRKIDDALLRTDRGINEE